SKSFSGAIQLILFKFCQNLIATDDFNRKNKISLQAFWLSISPAASLLSRLKKLCENILIEEKNSKTGTALVSGGLLFNKAYNCFVNEGFLNKSFCN
ncbi:hypothetical protein MHBO_004808, partial [Bonamia ostreae]